MFTRIEVQQRLDELATVRHGASILAPYSFEMRPVGFSRDDPNYRVIVERAAFRVKATVVPDYLAVAVVSAVVAGATHNPARLTRLIETLREMSWEPDILLSAESFRLEATYRDMSANDDFELADIGIRAGLALSEFVLDQLVITKSFGEMRDAVERSSGGEETSDLWLYDPSERDRSTQVHRSLENWLIATLRSMGIEPLDPAGDPFFDLAWKMGATTHVCEVKSSANSEVHQLRLGLGQVLEYQRKLERSGLALVRPSLLIESEPRDPDWPDICRRHGVLLFWPSLWDSIRASLTEEGADGPRN